MMKAWVDYIDWQDAQRGRTYLFDFLDTFGDWLALDGPTPSSFKGSTDDTYVSTLYYYRSTQMVKEMAQVLGKTEDVAHYAELEAHIKAAIAAGCDMILFNKDIREDYQFIRDALADGRLTWERVDEAVTRTLAMKAAMGLPERKAAGTLVPGPEALSVVGCAEHLAQAKECADKAVTLVKDTQSLLPISPEKYKKIRLYLLEDRVGGGFKDGEGATGKIKQKLEDEGFEVTLFDYSKPDFYEMFEGGVADIKSKFDLAVYVACIDTASNQSVRRIDWVHLMAADAPWFVNDVPALFVSLANPYHLVDAPMIKTFINAYTPTEEVVDAVVDKLMGRSAFKGVNPVDPFCGVWGAKF